MRVNPGKARVSVPDETPRLRPVPETGDGSAARAHTAPDAEMAVLGAILLAPELASTLEPELEPGDFTQPRHETIWRAIHTVAATGTRPDQLLVLSQLATTGELTKIGGGPYLHDLMAACPLPAQAREYARMVRDAARLLQVSQIADRLRQIGAGTKPDSIDDALATAVDQLDAAAARFGPRATRPTSWAPQDITPALSGHELDPPPVLMPRSDGNNLVYAAAIHTLSGEPGCGKTWIALHAAACALAAGHDVIYIDFEDRASRVVARLLALGAKPDAIAERFHYIRPNHPIDSAVKQQLERTITNSALAVIDGVTEAMTLHGLDLAANIDVATFYALLPRWIADLGPAALLIDHVVKDSDRQGRWSIGGQHKLAGLDGAAYGVKAVTEFGRGRIGTSRITIAKDRPGYIEQIALGRTAAEFHLDARLPDAIIASLDPPATLPHNEAGDIRPTFLMARVSAYLAWHPEANRKDIEDGVKGKRDYVRKAIDSLIHEGYVDVIDGDRGAKIHRLIQAFDPDNEGPDHDTD